MNILFFEMNKNFQYNNTKYYRYTPPMRPLVGDPIGPHKLGYGADRVWCWNPKTGKVRFIKNRYTTKRTDVDPKEFLMVQLSAAEWKDET